MPGLTAYYIFIYFIKFWWLYLLFFIGFAYFLNIFVNKKLEEKINKGKDNEDNNN